MPIDQNDAEQLKAARDIAEEALAEAKRAADVLRTAYARALLTQAFPSHSLAVFARSRDEDEAKLIQLVSSTEGVDDLELTEEAVYDALSPEQKHAFNEADSAIALIGDDDDLWGHLEAPDEEHDDWYEFDLYLGGAEQAETEPHEPASEEEPAPVSSSHAE